MKYQITQHTYVNAVVLFSAVLSLLSLRSGRCFLAALFLAIPVALLALRWLGHYMLDEAVLIPWTESALSFFAFVGGTFALWRSRPCDHDWYCSKPHQGHDISLNIYRCTKCGEEDHRIE